jgi:DDE superfamily endonuclease
MANPIIQKFNNFRQKIFSFFHIAKDALMNLVDATAAHREGDSIVKISLNGLYCRHFSSISQAIASLFRQKCKNPVIEEERKAESLKLTQLFAEQCLKPEKRSFSLFGMDCTSQERLFAEKLEDRTMVYAPNRVHGKIPVTIGHQYSLLAFLPEKTPQSSSTWLVPLSIQRVKSDQKAADIGMEQLKETLKETEFKDVLCVNVSDTAYSAKECMGKAQVVSNLIHIARLRGNRVLYFPLQESNEPKKRGRPKCYGEPLYLKEPQQKADEQQVLVKQTKRGRDIQVKIERWYNLSMRGKEPCKPFDVVRITVSDKEGKSLYAHPLWLSVVGEKRRDLSLEQIFDSYSQRYDLEHFFRFGKRQLQMSRFQTPEVEHEENWWWICLIAYMMLYMSRNLTEEVCYPWEKKKEQSSLSEQSPSRVQRDYERIIRQIGTPARIPKRRGKSAGRRKGQIVAKRPKQPIIKKGKKGKKLKKAA